MAGNGYHGAHEPSQMAMIMVGVVLLAAAAWAINRAMQVPVPVWSSSG